MLPLVTLTGTLVRDVELRFTPNGMALAKGRVACNDRKKGPDGSWVDGDTCFLDLTWFKAAAEAAVDLVKGNRIVVSGRLTMREWQDDGGNKRTAYEVLVSDVGRLVMPNARPAVRPAAAWEEDAAVWKVDDSVGPGAGWGSQAATDYPPF